MRPLLALSLVAAFGVLALAGSAAAQAPPGTVLRPACHGHAELTEMLSRKHAEVPSALGLQSNGHLLEVFVSRDGTTWSIVSTRPDGWSCIVAVGKYWETLPNPITEPAV